MTYRLTMRDAKRLRTEDERWVNVMTSFGFAVSRVADGWVTYDGAGTISVVPDDELDPDDTLAQILLHELLHHMVQGEDSAQRIDWGLDNTSDVHIPNEHATLRLQARLLDLVGLRDILVPTTNFRAYYEALPHPLPPTARETRETARGERLAEEGWDRLMQHTAFPELMRALQSVQALTADLPLRTPVRM